jgi:hypothetical protein
MIASITRTGWLSYRAPPRELSDAGATAGQDVNGDLVGQRHVRREEVHAQFYKGHNEGEGALFSVSPALGYASSLISFTTSPILRR